MSASSLLRVAARGSTSTFFRANTIVVRSQAPLVARAGLVVPSLLAASNFSTSARLRSDDHAEESFEEFTAR
jgi:cytochrome c oxidase subunit 5a